MGVAANSPVGQQQYQISTPLGVPPFPLGNTVTVHPPGALKPPAPTTEVDELKRRLEAAEIKFVAQALGTPKQEDLLERQTQIFERLAQPKGAQSTIIVKPEIKWPKLDDNSTGPKDAEDFFKKFEGFTGLANNGSGMPPAEELITLRQNLGGSRLQIYENIKDVRDADGTTKVDPKAVYIEVKQRPLKFKETHLERQMRVKKEFDELHKTRNMNALQFEAA